MDKQLFHNVDDDWLRPSANQKAAYFDLKSDYRRNDEYCMISGFGRTQGKSYFTQLQIIFPIMDFSESLEDLIIVNSGK